MMRYSNPFTPAFGGKPSHFFGRTEELSMLRRAMRDQNSPYRAVFITGNRGYGKTALLEQVSSMASGMLWTSIDVHSTHASQTIVRQLAPSTQQTRSRSLQPSGLGFSSGSLSVSDARIYDELDLCELLLSRSRELPRDRGILITVDEVQKIPEDDMEQLCGAFQMSLRKGMPVMLVLAGLPYAKEKVSSYEGCTFMQRAQELRLESLLVSETTEAFNSLLTHASGIVSADGTVDALARKSLGHPYLMQLLGYHLIEREAERQWSNKIVLEPKAVEETFPIAYDAYRVNVLDPTLSRLGQRLVSYLAAASSLLDSNRKASTSEIARSLGLSDQQASSYRQRLIQRRLIVPNGWGYVSLGLPYLDRYFSKNEAKSELRADSWRY